MAFQFGLSMVSGAAKESALEATAPADPPGHRRHRRLRRLSRKLFRDPIVGLSFLATVLLFLAVLSWGIFKAMGLDR